MFKRNHENETVKVEGVRWPLPGRTFDCPCVGGQEGPARKSELCRRTGFDRRWGGERGVGRQRYVAKRTNSQYRQWQGGSPAHAGCFSSRRQQQLSAGEFLELDQDRSRDQPGSRHGGGGPDPLAK